MSTISKVFTVVNIVLAMFLLGSVAGIVSEENDWRERYEAQEKSYAAEVLDLDQQLAEQTGRANSKAKEAEDRLDEVSNAQRDAQAATLRAEDADGVNRELRANLDDFNDTLTELTAQKTSLAAKRDELEGTVDSLTAERNTAVDDKRMAENAQARLEKDVEGLERDIADFESRLTVVTERRDVLLAEQSALTKLGVNIPMLIGNNVPPIDGFVSDVGSGFVVLSVGEGDGVKIGFPFDVYRSGTYIGRVVVDRIYPDNCIARVMMTNPDQQFMSNDKASTRL